MRPARYLLGLITLRFLRLSYILQEIPLDRFVNTLQIIVVALLLIKIIIMNISIENLFITVESVKVNDEIQCWKMINPYWFTMVEYGGEKKERFRYLSKNLEVRKLYESVLKEYVVVEKVMKIIDVDEMRFKIKYPGAKYERSSMANNQFFVGIERKNVNSEKELFSKSDKFEKIQKSIL